MTPSRHEIARQLDDMTSGECRWIGENRVHVYCHAPLVEERCPLGGRMKWTAGPRRFRVVCPGVYEASPADWFAAAGDAAWRDEQETIDRILVALQSPAIPPRPHVPYGEGRTRWEQLRDLYPVATKGL